jgi:threonine aldolase
MGKVDLGEVAAAKARLEAAGKEISDEALEAEIRLMHEEKRSAEKIAPELRVEGITVGIPPETNMVTLTRTVVQKQYRVDESVSGPTNQSEG